MAIQAETDRRETARASWLRRGIRNLSVRNARTVTMTSIFSVVLWLIHAAGPSAVLADQQLQMKNVAYQSGTITAIHEKTFEIDHRVHQFTPDVVIVDENGQSMEAGDLAVTVEVKFHVKKDQGDKIDYMILFLPR